MWDTRIRRSVEGCWDWNAADVGKVKVGRIVYSIFSGGVDTVRKAYLYTRHEWEEALDIHRPAGSRIRGLEDETACQLIGLGRWTGRDGGFGRIATPIIYSPDAPL